MQNEPAQPVRRHLWPWFVLGLFVLGVLLAILWMSVAIRQAEQRRGYIIPTSDNTNATAKPPS